MKQEDATKLNSQLLLKQGILAAGIADPDLTDIPFTVTTSMIESGGQIQLKADLKIDSAGIGFEAANDGRACKLYIALCYADAKGKIFGSDLRKIEGSMDEETFSQIKKNGILLSTRIPIKEKRQMVRIVVYDEQTDKSGSKLVRLP